MPSPQQITELLLRWEAECEQGKDVSLEDLCRDCPELIPELRLHIDALRVVNRMVQEPPADPYSTVVGPPTTPPAQVGSEQTRKIRCPHCHNPLQLVENQSDEVLCPGCGSTFRVCDARPTTSAVPMKALGKFQLLERVGVGGFGAVWKARDTSLDRVVALKIPHSGLVSTGDEQQRFQREAKAAAQLRHPGIVTVHEVVTLDGLPTLVSDFVTGVPLKDFIEVRRLTFRESAELVTQIADAVHYAHSMGVVHRDLKPGNILLQKDQDGPTKTEQDQSAQVPSSFRLHPLITDFGLALRPDTDITLTQEGHVLGTPAYMSPEQASGKSHQADARSDVYSLGVVLYELLTGELPFRGSKMMLMIQVVSDEPKAPRSLNDKIPRDLETICLKAMAKEPARRYVTARAVAEDLRRFLSGDPIQARAVGTLERTLRWIKRRPTVAALVAAVLLLSLLGVGAFAWAFDETLRARDEAVTALKETEESRQKTAKALHDVQEAYKLADREKKNKERELLRAESLFYGMQTNKAHEQLLNFDLIGCRLTLDETRSYLRGPEYGYLVNQLGNKALTLFSSPAFSGPAEAKRRVVLSADGKRLASASADGTITVWDLDVGKQTFTLREPNYRVPSLVSVGKSPLFKLPPAKWLVTCYRQSLRR